MKNLTKLANSVPRAIGLGLVGAVLCGTMGCASMTRAQKTALLGQGLSILGSIPMPGDGTKEGDRAKQIISISGTVITNQAKMQHDLEYANAGKSQIIINNNPPVYQSQNYNQLNNLENKLEEEYEKIVYSPDVDRIMSNPNPQQERIIVDYIEKRLAEGGGSITPEQKKELNEYLNALKNRIPEGLFMYKRWADFNINGQVDSRDELIGFNESVYDIRNLDGLNFSFSGGGGNSYDGQNLDFKIYSLEDGKIINYFNERYIASSGILNFDCESRFFPESGKYKAVLNTGNNKTFSLNFEIIK